MTEFQPKPQTPEQVDEGLRNAFRQAIKDGVMDATPYLKQMNSNKEIELLKQEIKMLQSKLSFLEELEKTKSPVEEAYKEWWGQYPELETDSQYDDMRWQGFQAGYELAQVKDGCPEPPDEPEHYDEVEWDEKDNPKSVYDAVERLAKEYRAQKLWNILKDKWGFSKDACGDIVEAVAEWLPKEQSAAGSQNVDTELLVDGFNHCLEKIKGMLR
jgi:hypothetical protein